MSTHGPKSSAPKVLPETGTPTSLPGSNRVVDATKLDVGGEVAKPVDEDLSSGLCGEGLGQVPSMMEADERPYPRGAKRIEGPSLQHPAYTTPVKLPYYNCAVTAKGACTATDAAKILIRLNPGWTAEDHRRLSDQHASAAEAHDVAWSEAADEAALATWGRKYQVFDYRVSGIASNEFSTEHKDRLRFHAHSKTYHSCLAAAHREASRNRNRYRDHGEAVVFDPRGLFSPKIPAWIKSSAEQDFEFVGPFAFRVEASDREESSWNVYRCEMTMTGDRRDRAVLTVPVDRSVALDAARQLNDVVAEYFGGEASLPDGVRSMRQRFGEWEAWRQKADAAWATLDPDAGMERVRAILSDGKWHSEHDLWKAFLGADDTPTCAANGDMTEKERARWAVLDEFWTKMRGFATSVNVGWNVYDWRLKEQE